MGALLLPPPFWLGAVPPTFLWLLPFVLCWAVADWLLTIVRAAGTGEILGRERYGIVGGAPSLIAVLPRTLGLITLALVWEMQGGYDAAPWLLGAVGLLSAASFLLALQKPDQSRILSGHIRFRSV